MTGQPAADSGSSKISKPSAARPLRPKSEAQAPALAQTQAPVPIPIPAPAPTPQQQQSPAISSIEMPNDASNGDSKTAFESVLRGLQKAIEEVSRSKAGLTKVAVSNKIYANYSVPNYRNGHGSHRVPVEEILHYNAPALLKHLDASKWGENDFFPWLQEMSETTFNPIATSKSKFPFKLVPRASRQTDSKATATSTIRTSAVGSRATDQSADDDSDDVIVTPRRRGKGVKTPGRLGKSNLRPVASSKKRLHSEIDDDSDSDSPIAKKSLYFSDGDEVMDDTNDDGILKEEDSDDQKVEIIIRADRIPSTIPKGPDNTWTCDQDDCHYIVRGNDAEECQERIEQHFEEHEERSERLRLAMSESQGHRIKYAYFPPFLILVYFHDPEPSRYAPCPPENRESVNSPPPSPTPISSTLEAPGTVSATPQPIPDSAAVERSSEPSQSMFRRLLEQFRRRPHPVSDRISNLTIPFQPPSRQD